MSEINVYVCRSKAIAKNYHQALQEKTIEKAARVEVQQRLEAVEMQARTIKEAHDRAEER